MDQLNRFTTFSYFEVTFLLKKDIFNSWFFPDYANLGFKLKHNYIHLSAQKNTSNLPDFFK
jgi:hypothetical protein